eukprot:1633511-Amphidinium_carterae.2
MGRVRVAELGSRIGQLQSICTGLVLILCVVIGEYYSHKVCRACSATAPAWVAKAGLGAPPLQSADVDG